jgi:hypothetical protein
MISISCHIKLRCSNRIIVDQKALVNMNEICLIF